MLLAVNVDRGSITAQFDIHDLTADSIAVMFEGGRSVVVANSSFTDSFESMDVHGEGVGIIRVFLSATRTQLANRPFI